MTRNKTSQLEGLGLPEITAAGILISTVFAVATGYHGAVRNDSLGWGIAWGALGFIFPGVTMAYAFGQGFAKPPCKR